MPIGAILCFYYQDVTSGDIHIGSLANTDLPGADTFSVPEDILLTRYIAN